MRPSSTALLHAQVPFRIQLAQVTSQIAAYPTFQSTPVLRADVARTADLGAEGGCGHRLLQRGPAVRHQDGCRHRRRLVPATTTGCRRTSARGSRQAPSKCMRPPSCRRTKPSWPVGTRSKGAIYVLEGVGPGQRQTRADPVGGRLPEPRPPVQRTFRARRRNRRGPAADESRPIAQFAATIQQGLNVALNNLRPPFLGNLTFAGDSMAPGLHYLAALNLLVTQASADLQQHRGGTSGRRPRDDWSASSSSWGRWPSPVLGVWSWPAGCSPGR